jgi:hypothetical protein
MDKSTARALGIEVAAALKAVADRHGMTIEVNGGRFDSGTYQPRVMFKEGGNDEREFARDAPRYGLTAVSFGRPFVSQGETYIITGIAPASHVRPVLARRVSDDRTYKFPAKLVVASLNGESV